MISPCVALYGSTGPGGCGPLLQAHHRRHPGSGRRAAREDLAAGGLDAQLPNAGGQVVDLGAAFGEPPLGLQEAEAERAVGETVGAGDLQGGGGPWLAATLKITG